MKARWRSLLARAQASTQARKRSLVALFALSLAAPFVAGTALGVGAEHGGWGILAIVISVPVALIAGIVAGRALLAGAQSVRRTHSAHWMVEKLRPLELAVRDGAPLRVDIVHPAIDLKH